MLPLVLLGRSCCRCALFLHFRSSRTFALPTALLFRMRLLSVLCCNTLGFLASAERFHDPRVVFRFALLAEVFVGVVFQWQAHAIIVLPDIAVVAASECSSDVFFIFTNATETPDLLICTVIIFIFLLFILVLLLLILAFALAFGRGSWGVCRFVGNLRMLALGGAA